MHQQHAHRNNKRRTHPQQLLAMLAREIEHLGMVLVVTGGIDVQPPEQHDAQIQQYRHPVVSFLLGYRQSVVIHYLLLGFLILRVSGSFWQGLISV